MSDLDLADAEFAIERRAYQLLRDDGFGLGNAGIGLVEGSLRGINRRLRPELARGELPGAIELLRGHSGLRLEARKVALLRSVE